MRTPTTFLEQPKYIRSSMHTTLLASGSLTYLMGCRIASNDSYQVSYLKKRVVLTKAAGDAELVLWDGGEFGHLRMLQIHPARFNQV